MWEERAVLFGTYLVDKGAQSSTIKSYFSAIKHILITDGYAWDNNKVMLGTITKSCRILNDCVCICLPIHSRLLDEILFELECFYGGLGKTAPQPYLEKLYKAAFSLAYYGLMRVGELALGTHTVKAKDVHLGMNKDKLLLVLHTSKTHGKESHPQKIKISARDSEKLQKKFFCPFRVREDYMNIRGIYEHDQEPFLVFADRTPVTQYQFHSVLKTQLDRLQLDSSLYNCQSLRIGCATDMIHFGYSFSLVKKAGRWHSNAIYRYLKD